MSGSKGQELQQQLDDARARRNFSLQDYWDILNAALRAARVEGLKSLRDRYAPWAIGESRDSVDGCGNYDDYYSAGCNDTFRQVVEELNARIAELEREGEQHG